MMTEEIRAELKAIASTNLDWDGPLPDGELRQLLDSIELMTLIVAVEDRFRIVLEPEDEVAIATIADLVAVIRRKVS